MLSSIRNSRSACGVFTLRSQGKPSCIINRSLNDTVGTLSCVILRRAKAAQGAFDGLGRTIIDGPFAETKEVVAGFWLWEVNNMDEAVAWVKRCPNPMPESRKSVAGRATAAARRRRLYAAPIAAAIRCTRFHHAICRCSFTHSLCFLNNTKPLK